MHYRHVAVLHHAAFAIASMLRVMHATALTTSGGAPLDSEIISPLSATMKAFPGTQ